MLLCRLFLVVGLILANEGLEKIEERQVRRWDLSENDVVLTHLKHFASFITSVHSCACY